MTTVTRKTTEYETTIIEAPGLRVTFDSIDGTVNGIAIRSRITEVPSSVVLALTSEDVDRAVDVLETLIREIKRTRRLGKESLFKCLHCNAVSEISSGIEWHVAVMHSIAEPELGKDYSSRVRYVCQHCNSVCHSFNDIVQHQLILHGIEWPAINKDYKKEIH